MALYRTEAVEAQSHQRLGAIVVTSTRVSWLLSTAVMALVVCLLTLVVRGEYTRRATVSGYLIPTTGVIRVYSTIAGRLKAIDVREGQRVSAGQRLAVIADERVAMNGAEAREALQTQIEARKESLRSAMGAQSALYAKTREGLERRIAALALEIEQAEREQSTQRTRLSYAETTRSRYRELAAQGFVSATVEQERVEAVVEQHARLQTLERNGTSLRRELLGLREELAELPMRERAQLGDLERAFAGVEQEGIENRMRGEVAVTAPQPGRVSALVAELGHSVGTDKPLLTLVPDGAQLEAHLFAPSKDIGFVHPGQQVAMRYSAFPYQKFGHYKGMVTEVSRTPLDATELAYPVAPKMETSSLVPAIPPAPAAEPLFRVRVKLDQQAARVYGRGQSLQPGMQLEADIMLDRRTLFEWILEPVYSIRGKYFQ